MRNLLFNISYNGTNYHGYQVQNNAITVAQTLQNAIEKVIKVRQDIVGCSRTDAKVHANNYYFNMKTESKIPTDKFVIALNSVLPDDICIKNCREVSNSFHARYNCTSKEYIYKIWNNKIKNPFLKDLALHYKIPIDVMYMNKCAKEFIGTYDFKSFCSSGAKEMSTIRTIYDCSVLKDNDVVVFKVRGDGFLYNMVRIMVGTLIELQEQSQDISIIKDIIYSKDRTKAGRTCKPQGLYLNQVFYGDENNAGCNK